MNTVKLILVAAALVALLWVAYNIGKVILRLVAGLLFLALIAALIWIIFFKKPQTRNHPLRSQHGSHILPPLWSKA